MQNLSNYSIAELRTLEAQVEEELEKRHILSVGHAREKILCIMREHGLTVTDLGTFTKSSKILKREVHKRAEIKYRDNETGDTWTGRGRVPKWLQGKDKNHYLIISRDNFFVSEIRKMEYHILNHKPGIEADEKIGITPKHYIDKHLADEWRRKTIKKFHPDTAQKGVLNPEAASEKINKLYNRLVGKA